MHYKEHLTEARAKSKFAENVLKGLKSTPKYLSSKYFYDDKGSKIFQQIMQMPEYYLTQCEQDILINYGDSIVKIISRGSGQYHLIELGSGDGQKTQLLLHKMVSDPAFGYYMPIDISDKANQEIRKKLSATIPHDRILPQTGDYFDMIANLGQNLKGRKVILFLGSNIGNFSEIEIAQFLGNLYNVMNCGDFLLIGFDLKKSPDIIQKAYDDPHGLTKNFNINLLHRINEELDADIQIENFDHLAQYDPVSGEMRSFLVSGLHQRVKLGCLGEEITFSAQETIFTELSRKYDADGIQRLANIFNFRIVGSFTDQKGYFLNSLWIKQ